MELEVDAFLVEIIKDAARKAISNLFQEHNERFYYCSLITTGEALCPVISAWSTEALEAMLKNEEDIDEARYYLKWAYAESPYFAYGEEYFQEVKEVFNKRWLNVNIDDEEEWEKEVQIRINSMERAMADLDAEGLFGTGEQRLNIVVNAEFMPPDYTNTQRALRLNPKEALSEWLEEAAETERLKKIILDVSKVKTSSDLHKTLKTELGFPDFYGMNWAAFWDSITGLVELPEQLVIEGWTNLVEVLPRDAQILKELLDRLNSEYPVWGCTVQYN